MADKEEVDQYDLFVQEYLSEQDIKSRSLLNRDGDGNLKFSHKSILEYFLAKDILEKPQMLKEFPGFEGWDMVQFFLQEYGLLPEMMRVQGGSFEMGSKDRDNEMPIHRVELDSFSIAKYPITQRPVGTAHGK